MVFSPLACRLLLWMLRRDSEGRGVWIERAVTFVSVRGYEATSLDLHCIVNRR